MMKQIVAFLLLLLAFRCTKIEGDYVVDCKLTPFLGGKTILVVTNDEGNVLKTFDIPLGVSSFTGQFSYSDKGNLAERYDLHLIHLSNEHWVNIYSKLGIKDDESVYFYHNSNPNLLYRPIKIHIAGVESFDALNAAEPSTLRKFEFFPAEKKVKSEFLVRENHGFLMRMRANGETDFRLLYLPDSLMRDSITVSWQDFKPEEINIHEIEVPSDIDITYLEVTAISPDFKHAVLLHQDSPNWNTQHQVSARFNHPAVLADLSAYCIQIEEYANVTTRYEQYFAPGEPLHFEPVNMKIVSIDKPNNRLTVQTEGDIDLLWVTSSVSTPDNNTVNWQIGGEPKSFNNRPIPDFREYLPFALDISELYNQGTGTVGAYQFDKYDYEQVREGFPFILNEPFVLARSGYKIISKPY